jgi:NAD-dependent deacetylase
MDEALARARDALAGARSIVVLTGAGISAESGIPTFRDAMTGLWARFRPDHLATPEAFRRDPKTVWEGFLSITQNVDGLHAVAGSRRLVELHGNIFRVRCFDAGHPAETWRVKAPFHGPAPSAAPCCGPMWPGSVYGGRGRRSVIAVNPYPTPLTPRASLVLRGPAGSVLPGLVPA